MRPSRQPVRASRLGRDQLWSSVESVDRCLDQSRARLCRSRVRLLHYSSESSKRVAAQEPSSTQGSKSKQNRREKCARGMIAGRSCILSARSRICATRPDVTWRLRPHNIVLVPAAGELASYHRCHVRASRGPLGFSLVALADSICPACTRASCFSSPLHRVRRHLAGSRQQSWRSASTMTRAVRSGR